MKVEDEPPRPHVTWDGTAGSGHINLKRMISMTSTEHEKTRAAAERVDDQLGFYVHFAVYLLVNALLVGLNIQSGDPWWAQWPALGWGIGIIAHGLGVFGRAPRVLVGWRLRRINRMRSQL